MRGRKPKPSMLNELHGRPGHRPVNRGEPRPGRTLGEPPEDLTDEQKAIWRIALADAPPGLVTALDEEVFRTWVTAAALRREAARKVGQFGLVTKSPDKGVPMQNPYLAIMNKQAAIMLKAAAELGFSPSARSRLHVQGGERAGWDEFDEFLAEGDRIRAGDQAAH